MGIFCLASVHQTIISNSHFKEKLLKVHYDKRICIFHRQGINRTCLTMNTVKTYIVSIQTYWTGFKGMLGLHMTSFNMHLYVYIQEYIQLVSKQSSHKIHRACRQIKRYLVDSEVTFDPVVGGGGVFKRTVAYVDSVVSSKLRSGIAGFSQASSLLPKPA